MKSVTWACLASLVILVGGNACPARAQSKATLVLSLDQKELLTLEPILVRLRLDSKQAAGLPAGPGKSGIGELRFEVQPPVKPRDKALPLPLEAKADAPCSVRTYDLLEWFQFPNGSFTVNAVLDHQGTVLASTTVSFTIAAPDSKGPEAGPVARLHHPPWSNYVTDAFCGDTFDLVKQWPTSRLAKYSHYWNGLHLQHKKEYAKALDSFRTVGEQYPEFVLADAAEYGVVECLEALGKKVEARQANALLQKKLHDRAAKAGLDPSCHSTLQRLTKARADALGQ